MDDDCSATHKGSSVVGMGLGTSVTAARMTDAYGASTRKGASFTTLYNELNGFCTTQMRQPCVLLVLWRGNGGEKGNFVEIELRCVWK